MSDYLKKRQEYILQGRPLKVKEKKGIAKVSEKRKKKLEEEKEARGGNDSELLAWYKKRVKQMSGYCAETGLKTETKIFQYAIMSVCHILPKATCKSVSTHPLNWIELNCDFHTKFDAMSWEEREKLGCWSIIQERLVHVYECLDPLERRHFPESVLKYMENKKPF